MKQRMGLLGEDNILCLGSTDQQIDHDATRRTVFPRDKKSTIFLKFKELEKTLCRTSDEGIEVVALDNNMPTTTSVIRGNRWQ